MQASWKRHLFAPFDSLWAGSGEYLKPWRFYDDGGKSSVTLGFTRNVSTPAVDLHI